MVRFLHNFMMQYYPCCLDKCFSLLYDFSCCTTATILPAAQILSQAHVVRLQENAKAQTIKNKMDSHSLLEWRTSQTDGK